MGKNSVDMSVCKDYMRRERISQDELAELADISYRSLCNYLNHRTAMPLWVAMEIAKVADMRVDELFPAKESRRPVGARSAADKNKPFT